VTLSAETLSSERLPALVSAVANAVVSNTVKPMSPTSRRSPPGGSSADAATGGTRILFGLKRRRIGAVAARSNPVAVLHRSVRATTRGEQMLIEQIMGELDFGRREDYGSFLDVHYTALQILEPEWRAEDRDDFGAMLECVHDDLRKLHMPTTRLFLIAPGMLNIGGRLGVGYIIRGSRLSAKFLCARVASGFAVSYLKCVPENNWDHFLRDVAQTLGDTASDVRVDDVVQGAQIAMQRIATLFERAALRGHRT
jgi:hypothetical protein